MWTGDDIQQLFCSSLRTEVELERDTRSRSSETRAPGLLEDLSSVCVSDLHEFDCPLNVHSNFESHTFFQRHSLALFRIKLSSCNDHEGIATLPWSSDRCPWNVQVTKLRPICRNMISLIAGRGHSGSCRHWMKQSHGRCCLLATSPSGTKVVTRIDERSGARQRQKFKNLGSQYLVMLVSIFLLVIHCPLRNVPPHMLMSILLHKGNSFNYTFRNILPFSHNNLILNKLTEEKGKRWIRT